MLQPDLIAATHYPLQVQTNSRTGLKVETQRYFLAPGEHRIAKSYFPLNGDTYSTATDKKYDLNLKRDVDKNIFVWNERQLVAKTTGLPSNPAFQKRGAPSLLQLSADVLSKNSEALREEDFHNLPEVQQDLLRENAGFQAKFPKQLTTNATRLDFLKKSLDSQKKQLENLIACNKPESAAELLKAKNIFNRAKRAVVQQALERVPL
jgi:hypothetical protein